MNQSHTPGCQAPDPTTTTVAAAAWATMDRVGDRVLLHTSDGTTVTYRQAQDRVSRIAGGLASLGVRRGDTVALMINAGLDFPLIDLAALTLGATTVSIYLTSSPEQISYLLTDSGANLAIVDPALADKFFTALPEVPAVKTVVSLTPDERATRTLADLEAAGEGYDPRPEIAAGDPGDVITLIYTSGTTSAPKGVEFTNTNALAAVQGWQRHLELPDEFRVISWLPNAHVAERVAHLYLPLVLGGTVFPQPDATQITATLPAARPTFFFAPPRFWEKAKAGIEAQLMAAPEAVSAQMLAALEAARTRQRLLQTGQPIPDELDAVVTAADATLFAGLRATLGLDAAVNTVSAAAPLVENVLEFFLAIGLPFSEGWGMSETGGSGTLTPKGKPRVGTVGVPMPGIELKIADDGEILMRGLGVTRGYRNKPELTSAAIDENGWLSTGDLGEIGEDGYLKILGRKKEIIINAAGKNMSPHLIESAVKSTSPLIGQCVVIGDAKPYNTMLVVPDPDVLRAWAEQAGVPADDRRSQLRHPDLQAEVSRIIDEANATLSRVEQVKRFTVIEDDWLPDSDELTPTMKLRRNVIVAKYQDEIDGLYAR